MIYPIVKYGDRVLETPAATVTVFDKELEKLTEDMFESMYAAHGVGLAAPQIGIGKRIAVIDPASRKTTARSSSLSIPRSSRPKASNPAAKAA